MMARVYNIVIFQPFPYLIMLNFVLTKSLKISLVIMFTENDNPIISG